MKTHLIILAVMTSIGTSIGTVGLGCGSVSRSDNEAIVDAAAQNTSDAAVADAASALADAAVNLEAPKDNDSAASPAQEHVFAKVGDGFSFTGRVSAPLGDLSDFVGVTHKSIGEISVEMVCQLNGQVDAMAFAFLSQGSQLTHKVACGQIEAIKLVDQRSVFDISLIDVTEQTLLSFTLTVKTIN